MNITLRYFASLREALGTGDTLQVEPGTSVGALRDRLIAQSPAHAAVLARTRAVRCAVDQSLCDENLVLEAGSEVAFFPPVTGG